jgi:hypothetical protein
MAFRTNLRPVKDGDIPSALRHDGMANAGFSQSYPQKCEQVEKRFSIMNLAPIPHQKSRWLTRRGKKGLG